MSFGPEVETTSNVAAPLGEDFIKQLQGQLAQGRFNTSSGRAGEAINQLVSGGLDRVGSGGVSPQSEQLVSAIQTRAADTTARLTADAKEVFGQAGTRFGTTAALGVADITQRVAIGANEQIAQVLQDQAQFDINSLLTAIGLETQLGAQDQQLLAQILGLTLAPPENIVTPGLGNQLLSGVIQGGAAFLGAS